MKIPPLHVIAVIHNAFSDKFGIPRQSGMVSSLHSKIVFEPDYCVPESVKGLEEFSHIWIIWQFSQAVRDGWSPTVRPPKLGGNKRVGVFSTRSPFRPNSLGLSCVKLEKIEFTEQKQLVLWVSGADLMDGTPIFDIKPYLTYVDCVPQAKSGFGVRPDERKLIVDFPASLQEKLEVHLRLPLMELLEQDPRPGYQEDETRQYGMRFGGYEIKFKVVGQIIQVCEIEKE